MDLIKTQRDLKNLEADVDNLVKEILGCGTRDCRETCHLSDNGLCSFMDLHTSGRIKAALRVLKDRQND